MGWFGDAPPFYPSSSHTARDRKELSEIVPKVYICNFKGAEDVTLLHQKGITHICAVGEEFDDGRERDESFTWWNKDITDDEHQGDIMAGALRDGAAFIHKGLSGGGCVLVHCAAGISRSASLVLGYLVLYREHSLRSAFGLVYAARPCIWPNEGFMAALIALEVAVRGGAPTITAAEYDRWGDWDGPLEEGNTGDGAPPMLGAFGPPRLVRDETFEDAEAAELDALDEASLRRKLLEQQMQSSSGSCGGSCESIAEHAVASAEAPSPLRAMGTPRSLDARLAHGSSSSCSIGSGTSTGSRPKRMSLSRAERRADAAAASEEARNSRASSRRPSDDSKPPAPPPTLAKSLSGRQLVARAVRTTIRALGWSGRARAAAARRSAAVANAPEAALPPVTGTKAVMAEPKGKAKGGKAAATAPAKKPAAGKKKGKAKVAPES